MIPTLLRIEWLNLKRDRVALLIVFALPLIFFSIFAGIFSAMEMGGGDGGNGGASKIKVVVIDEDRTDLSSRLVKAIQQDAGLEVTVDRTDAEGSVEPFTRDAAYALVRESKQSAAIILPEGFGETFGQFASQDRVPIVVVHDPTNPYAAPGVAGILQGIAMQSAPDLMMKEGLAQLENFGAGMTDAQRDAIELITPFLSGEKPWSEFEGGEGTDTEDSDGPGFAGLVPVETKSVQAVTRADDDDGDDDPSMIPYYAAGIGVMFLLFSMAGASGSLLKEKETGSLERVLTSNVSMTTLLGGKWMFFAIVGAIQVVMMFVFGEFVFGGMDLFSPRHAVPFIVMTLFTAGAAAAFGIMLASLVKTRGQLDGMSTIVILIMSALGGSMVPKFVAPAIFDKTAPFTFNGHALDGYLGVFWYAAPDDGVVDILVSILPQLGILTAMGLAFFFVARVLARRWEVA